MQRAKPHDHNATIAQSALMPEALDVIRTAPGGAAEGYPRDGVVKLPIPAALARARV